MKIQGLPLLFVIASPWLGAAVYVARGDDGAELPDVAACAKEAFKFIDFPDIAMPTLTKAFHYCEQRRSDCGHFQEMVERALEREYEGKVYTAEVFCEVMEGYMVEMHGAANVPRVGTGTLNDFEIAPTCESAVAAAFAPHTGLASAGIPEFWYSMCLNQDCAHFLQSRTRWCNLSRKPTHSIAVCEGVRRFAADEVAVHSASTFDPKQACDLYAEYVKELANDIEVYKSVMRENYKPKIVERSQSATTRYVAPSAILSLVAAIVAAAQD